MTPRQPPGGRPAGRCPSCQAPARPGERFCLRCRCDLATGAPLRPPALEPLRVVTWEARIDDERAGADGAPGPGRIVPLRGGRILLGRPGSSAGPDRLVDLSADPGVSERHAVLERAADGGYRVADAGSRDGTRLNARDGRRLAAGQAVPLRDGDRVYVGRWTRITLRRVEPPNAPLTLPLTSAAAPPPQVPDGEGR